VASVTPGAPAPLPGTPSPPPAPLGLGAAYRGTADQFDASTDQARTILTQGADAVDEPPAWGPAHRATLADRLWLFWMRLVLRATFGRVQLWRQLRDVPGSGQVGGPTLRQQIILERLPALRQAIREIRRRKRPIDLSALNRLIGQVERLRRATVFSWRAIRLRIHLLGLAIQIGLAWLWANREPIFFGTVIIAILVVAFMIAQYLWENWSGIATTLNSLIGGRLVPGGR
jgi:hypothetical protein